MARTQAADYDERREEIRDQAARLYAKRGFLGTSVSDLAKACGVSKSAIYHYYPSKDDILYDVMRSHIADLGAAARAAVENRSSGEAKLRQLSRSFMQLYVGAQARHKVLLNELDQLPKNRRAEIVALQRELIAFVGDILAQIEPRLAGDGGERFATTMLFFGMVNWTHTWFDSKGAVSAEDLADMVVDVMVGGLAKLR